MHSKIRGLANNPTGQDNAYSCEGEIKAAKQIPQNIEHLLREAVGSKQSLT
jgi:hypothetical protein